MEMRSRLCRTTAFAIASLVSMSPAWAGNPLDFFEYFQATVIVLETNFTDSDLDKILSISRSGNIGASSQRELTLKKSLQSAIARKDAEGIKKFLSDGRNPCFLKNHALTCHISKYEITRNVGDRDGPRTNRYYDYRVLVKDIDKAERIVIVNYVYKDDGFSQ